ncbi:MAG: HAMP domain-containing histidine kinase [Lachnospiraceae bacterium]|nr:HAMP domain-containing histidine kinase [Lachnospiraceae bacterium]
MNKIRLRTSLSLFFALLVAITVVLISFLSSTLISREFEEYVKETQKEEADNLAKAIESNYDFAGGGWNIDYVHGMGMYALNDGFILKLYDADKNMLWDAENHDMALCHEVMDSITHKMHEKRPDLKGDFVTYSYDLLPSGELKGVLEISYYTPFYLEENEFQFIKALNRILSLVGVAALIIAVILGVIIAGRITKPISGVIAVAGKIAEGNYKERVNINLKERETYELAEAVNHMTSVLEKQEFLRKRMTGDIAHELRTPVTNISSYMELMIDDVMTPTKERLKSCYDELSRLSGLISDLDRLESVESDDIPLEKEDVELYSLSDSILQSFESGLLEKNIEAKITGDEVHVKADRVRIGQVIANLLSNALKYTDESGKISLKVEGEKDFAKITVTDTGIGISKDEQSLVFERFYRTDKSRTRKTGGAGIGLTITKAIVKAHGGTIRVESEPGAGSSFIVTLPLN